MARAQGRRPRQNVIEQALKYGLSIDRLTMIRGARGAHLYRSVSVSRSVPAVSRGHSSEVVSECPTSLYREGHSGHSDDAVSTSSSLVSGQDTQNTWVPPGLGGRDGQF